MLPQSVNWRLSLVFFLLAAMPGCWIPVLANVLAVKGWQELTDWAFVIPSLGAVVSPLFLGALADQRAQAQRVLAIVLALNALATGAAFWFLEEGSSQFWFLFFLSLKALLGAPAWSLLMTVTLTHLPNPERQFGGVRVWGTLGWMGAGWLVSAMALDESAWVGMLAATFGLVGAVFCFTLPATPPQGGGNSSVWDALGLKAVGILKDRDTGVYFLSAVLFSVPLAAYYPYTAKYLSSLEIQQVAAMMSFGQASEVVAMLLMGWFLRKIRLKWIFLIALGAGTLRYGLFLIPELSDAGTVRWGARPPLIAGILMHGICWTLFFESGRLFVDRRVSKAFRSQAQALLTVLTGGIATILGVFLSGALYRWCVEGGGPGWNGFWGSLVLMSLMGFLVMALGYRGQNLTERHLGDQGKE